MKWISGFIQGLWIAFRTALKEFIKGSYIRYSASLSFYTIFSVAPLLIITISLSGFFFGGKATEGRLFSEIRTTFGDALAMQIQQMLRHAVSAQGSFFAKAVAIVMIILGIAGVFSEIQVTINHIWQLKTIARLDRKSYLIKRIISVALFSIIGLMLVLSLIVNWLIAIFGNYLVGFFAAASVYMVYAINRFVVMVIIAVLFTIMFKILPDAKVRFKDAVTGAVFTSILFILGKAGISFYLSYTHVASMYGAAGGLIILLLWIYFSSIIIYFGAMFTKVYANLYGGKIVPRTYARHLSGKES